MTYTTATERLGAHSAGRTADNAFAGKGARRRRSGKSLAVAAGAALWLLAAVGAVGKFACQEDYWYHLGAVNTLSEGGDPAELRRAVTSPGGPTAAALDVLMARGAIPELMRKAVEAAAKRGAELSREVEKKT